MSIIKVAKHISGLNFKLFSQSILFLTSIFVLAGCTTKDDFDFAPPVFPETTYTFKLTPPSGTGTVQYTLTDITARATKSPSADSWEYFIFMLKGKDKTSGAEVYITGRKNNSESYVNIAINNGSSSLFYKDCNDFQFNVKEGSDKNGNYVRLTNSGSRCFTPTLDSERRIDIEQYQALLNPLTFYID